eukprot:SAG31_NODE_1310_length_8870_cov_2.332231_6_plen_65_part_00
MDDLDAKDVHPCTMELRMSLPHKSVPCFVLQIAVFAMQFYQSVSGAGEKLKCYSCGGSIFRWTS